MQKGGWDHPRSRGDNAVPLTLIVSILGSPPLTRGQRNPGTHGQDVLGITPAHAGTTLMVGIVLPATQDHPRSRGDNALGIISLSLSSGSPPLTRGQLRPHLAKRQAAGITPAHAGTTGNECTSAWSNWDHPRSRGDN